MISSRIRINVIIGFSNNKISRLLSSSTQLIFSLNSPKLDDSHPIVQSLNKATLNPFDLFWNWSLWGVNGNSPCVSRTGFRLSLNKKAKREMLSRHFPSFQGPHDMVTWWEFGQSNVQFLFTIKAYDNPIVLFSMEIWSGSQKWQWAVSALAGIKLHFAARSTSSKCKMTNIGSSASSPRWVP
jgi:hypothetical protein